MSEDEFFIEDPSLGRVPISKEQVTEISFNMFQDGGSKMSVTGAKLEKDGPVDSKELTGENTIRIDIKPIPEDVRAEGDTRSLSVRVIHENKAYDRACSNMIDALNIVDGLVFDHFNLR